MPAWAVSLLITILQKTGAINWLEGLAIKGGLEGIRDLRKLKTYPEYPGDPPSNTPNNLHVDQP